MAIQVPGGGWRQGEGAVEEADKEGEGEEGDEEDALFLEWSDDEERIDTNTLLMLAEMHGHDHHHDHQKK